ncbi:MULTISPECIES: twin-arginine translocase TatA/TatE family subunit [unclassified Mesorhizobium]|uniref:twin-arginine translocase TatA/TatE family subunit n=1 Tax=unclassified Mesorhizobium TaxID=325217 RepID=UPI0003CEF919|nr:MULTISPECIES: twin-arginine translocase TatA/TatE family subunit [unclassified Mesorhizobium]ESX14260.1 preprotein translocase [Mesorhizobium sp. LSJC265A00]ESY08577.1 preprotein translocase [Mesorhizobium sp. LNJC399B00]
MGALSVWHLAIVLIVIIVLFGRGRISALMGDMGGGIAAFKRGLRQDSDGSRDRKLTSMKDVSKPE